MLTAKIFFLQLLLLLTCYLAYGGAQPTTQIQPAITCVVDVSVENPATAILLEEHFPQSFVVSRITVSADSKIDHAELRYLLSISEGAECTWQDLYNACIHLQLKRKFQNVTFTLTPFETSNGMHLDVKVQTVWTFGKVTFSGLLLGKDRYKHLYALESGEPFTIDHHKELLASIEESLRQEGFYNGRVSDYLEYHSDTKTVDVHIVLDHQDQFRVHEVEIELQMALGLTVEQQKHLKKALRTEVNSRVYQKRYTKVLVDSAGAVLRRYLAKAGYLEATIALSEDIDYEKAAIKLNFMVTLHERREIEFIGNHFFSANALYDLIASFGRSAWLVPPEVLAQEFEAAYRAKGFWNVSIEIVIEEDRVIFVIQEGQRARLKEVHIEGATLEVPDKLAKKWFSRVLKQSYIDQDQLQEQLSHMLVWYQHQGYWHVQILRQEFLSTEKSDTYALVLMIEEGEQRKLVSVKIDGHEQLLSSGPFVALSAQLPIPFDMALLHDQRMWLLTHFHEQGYLHARVTPQLSYEGHDCQVVWIIEHVEEPVTFGKTIVVGRTRTQFEYILRELRYKEGDVWDQSKLEDSLAALRHLSLFESLYVAPVPTRDGTNARDVLLKLVEYDPFEARLRAGFQQMSKNFTFRSGSTYKVGGALLWRNPFRVGDYFCFDADFAKYYRYVSLRYYRPWLGDSPYRTQFKLYSNKYIQPVSKGCKEPLYEVLQQGFLIGLSRAFTHVDSGGNIGIEQMETGNLSPSMARAINFSQQVSDHKIPLIFFEGSMLLDFLDDQVNPFRGSLTALSGKCMFPWKRDATAFLKILFEQSVFYDPINNVICGMKLRFGHIFGGAFSRIMPPERFYLGGEHSLRSYQADFAPPLGSFINNEGERIFVPQGGKSMLNASFEVRFPIYKNFGGVLFQDMGILAQNELEELKGGKFLAATGFGFRYLTPIGPVRFDIGFKWHRHSEHESLYAWFLTLGESF